MALTVLKNFRGTTLKLSELLFDQGITAEERDFQWACHDSLVSFKMTRSCNLTMPLLGWVATNLSTMPLLKKVKLEGIWKKHPILVAGHTFTD